MKRFFALYAVAIRAEISSAMAYRANFFTNFFISLITNLLTPLVTVFIYGAGASIPGWSMYEALLVQAVFMLCNGLCAPFFFNTVWTTMVHIREGTYDILLLKPCPVLLSTMAFSFDLEALGVLFGGLVMFIICLFKLPAPGFMSVMMFLLLLIMGACVLFGMVTLMTASAFKWVGNGRIFEIFDGVSQFGRHPGSVFPKWLSGVLSFVFPVAMLGFFPASALLGRGKIYMLLAAVPCVLFMLFGVWLFKRMVRGYQSAGG